MNTTIMKLSAIKQNPNNPRSINKDKFAKLVKSIEEFPRMLELRPIVLNKDNIVLGGNMRLKACKQIGLSEVPVVYADDLTEEEQRQFIIKDNVGFGDWDWELLANEWDVSDLNDWGLDLPDIDVQVLEAEEDNYEEPDNLQVDVVLGDLIEIGEHRLLCGDSTDSDQVARLMNGEKADMVFTDPPYDFEVGQNNFNEVIELYCSNAHVFVMHDDKGIVDYLRNSKLDFCGFFVADFTFSSPRGNNPYLKHILLSHEKKSNAIKHNNLHDGFGSIVKMKYRGFLDDEQTEHKHQKSIDFISKFILHFSLQKHLLFDIFLGSGSTMVAAHQLNRKCYGMELDPKYCQVIIDRMVNLDPTLEVKINGKRYDKK